MGEAFKQGGDLRKAYVCKGLERESAREGDVAIHEIRLSVRASRTARLQIAGLIPYI